MAIVLASVALAVSMRAQTDNATGAAFVDRYCSSCHSSGVRAGGLVLTGRDPARVDSDRATWEAVARRLRDGSMPPAGAPRPDALLSRRFTETLESTLDRAYAAAPRPGRPGPHRLNRVEYSNAIRDLLAVDVDAETTLPADPALDGFDNMGGVLSMSPLLMERYLFSARRITRLAVGDPSIDVGFGSALYVAPQDVRQDERMSESLPFGSRGGMVIRHRFPLDARYVVRVRLRRNILGYVRGLGAPHPLEVSLDGAVIGQFIVGGEPRGSAAPRSFSGVIAGSPAWEAYALSADAALDAQFQASAGTHALGLAFAEGWYEEEGVQQPPLAGLGWSYDESRTSPTGPAGPAIESVAVNGPFDATGPGATPSRERIFTCRPSAGDTGDACARSIFTTLATRAYRRPVTASELQTLLTFYRDGVGRRGFEEGIRAGLERLLIDPNFLFRLERDEPSRDRVEASRISDIDLASRLSFFLWSSIPDDTLRDRAVAGGLRDRRGLNAEVDRLLADARSSALVDNFAVQWLSLRRLREITPDLELYSSFDGNLRHAFEEETTRFVSSQLRENRSVLDLVNADYTFLNERLARHYGVAGVIGSRFRRVTLDDRRRRGLLGHGSILALTSYPTRTSPVVRGRWLLDTLIGSPPPPPPPDIPPLPPAEDADGARTVRQRTERHRRNPACATCHQRMDPLGFALENFDAIGRWRLVDESGAAVDASSVMMDGVTLSGVEGLRAFILAHPEDFARTVTAKLLTYALGRALEPDDAPAVRTIVRQAAPGGYRWSALIHGVVDSAPFQMRSAAR